MLNYTLCTVKPIMIIVNCVKSEHSCSSTTCTLLCMLQSKPNTLHSTTSASLPVGPSSVYLARIKKQPGEVHQNILVEKHLQTSMLHTLDMIENIELMTSMCQFCKKDSQ